MTKVVFTKPSKNNLVEIAKYIGKDNKKVARTYTNKITNKVKSLLETFPQSCPMHNKQLSIRKYIHEDYNVYYFYDKKSDTAFILHILHSSMMMNQTLSEI